jgi:hypothetical protein
MLEITNIKVSNLIESVLASGYAMMTEPYNKPLDKYTKNSEEFKKGLIRLMKLNKASKGEVRCHNHALCGINVSFDVKYPQYWSPEFQRYHFADIITSSSKMHKLAKMDLATSFNKYVHPTNIKMVQDYVYNYNKIKDDPNVDEEIKYDSFMKMLSNCPLGLELFMRVTTNYLELQNIYFQRRHHRLKEDWGAFCNFIESLPYSKELIIGDIEE